MAAACRSGHFLRLPIFLVRKIREPGHGSQRVLQQNLAQTAMTGVAASLSDMDYDKQRLVMGALGAGTKFGVLMPFSREHESEADHIGLIYMARAGYDPRESIRFWQRMEHTNSAQPPQFL